MVPISATTACAWLRPWLRPLELINACSGYGRCLCAFGKELVHLSQHQRVALDLGGTEKLGTDVGLVFAKQLQGSFYLLLVVFIKRVNSGAKGKQVRGKRIAF